jgi:hypothetical protein
MGGPAVTLDERLLAELDGDTSPVAEAKRRVIEGAQRWAAEHDVPIEETPQYATLLHLAKG